jgi:two-component system OmpR family response regulator
MNLFTNLFSKQKSKEHTIFIVDDNEVYAMLLQEFLMLRFPKIHKIKHFVTGEECIKELDKNPSVVIMDHLLNKNQTDAATGLSIIKKIKTVKPNTNVILLSGQKEIEVVSKTIAKYGAVYIPKGDEAFNTIEKHVKQFLKK